MKEKNLGALTSNMDILISGLEVLMLFELKGNFTDSMVRNTAESGDMHQILWSPSLKMKHICKLKRL